MLPTWCPINEVSLETFLDALRELRSCRPETRSPSLTCSGEDAMKIGALPSLANGPHARARTQEWARAIYEDQPVNRRTVQGVYYDAAHTNSLAPGRDHGRRTSSSPTPLPRVHVFPSPDEPPTAGAPAPGG